MPHKHVKYTCSVCPTDQLVTYVTDLEHPPHDEFVLVMTNREEQKISMVLSKDDAIRLREHLETYIINCAIKRV